MRRVGIASPVNVTEVTVFRSMIECGFESFSIMAYLSLVEL